MKRDWTLMKGKCNRMVKIAMRPSHHLKSENNKKSINFFSHSQLQYILCGHFSDYYYATLLIHSHAVVTKSQYSHRQSWRTNLGYSHAYQNKSGFVHGLNLDQTCFGLSKCNPNLHFTSISGFRKSDNSNFNLICYSWVSYNFYSNLF